MPSDAEDPCAVVLPPMNMLFYLIVLTTPGILFTCDYFTTTSVAGDLCIPKGEKGGWVK